MYLRTEPQIQRLTRDFVIIKVNFFVADYLIVLMALTCNQHNIAFARFIDSVKDGLTPVGQLYVWSPCNLEPHFDITDDRFGVLASWIVRRHYRHVAEVSCQLTHRCTLRPISIATTTEHSYDPVPVCDLPCGL